LGGRLESKIGRQPRGLEGGEETAACLKPGKQPRSEAAHVVDPEHVQARQVHGIERRHDTGLDVSEAVEHLCNCSVLPGRCNRDDASVLVLSRPSVLHLPTLADDPS
jgi:hypothetical protein